MNGIKYKHAHISASYLLYLSCPSIWHCEIGSIVVWLQWFCYFLCGFNPDKSFSASSIDGRSDGLLLVQSKATSRTSFTSSCIESVEPTSFSSQISLKSASLGLICVLSPAFVSLPLVKISRMISPKLYISMESSSFVLLLNSPVQKY